MYYVLASYTGMNLSAAINLSSVYVLYSAFHFNATKWFQRITLQPVVGYLVWYVAILKKSTLMFNQCILSNLEKL